MIYLEKKMFLAMSIILLFAFFLTGCVNAPNVGEQPQNPNPQPELPIEPDLSPQIPQGEVPKPPLTLAEDLCAWTLDLKNFELERNPSNAQGIAYRSCYNDSYILRVNSETPIEFCKEITDAAFEVECYKALAYKKNDITLCGQASQKTVYVKEIIENASASDVCFYRYVEEYSQVATDEVEQFACGSISTQRLKDYCISRMEYFKNR